MTLSDKETNRQVSSDEDGELVARARRGDLTAFERLVRIYQQKMFTIAFRITGSTEDAAEIVQDAFVNAWRGLGSFRGESSFRTWLTSITVNLSRNRLDSIRSRRSSEPVSLDDPVATAGGCCAHETVSGAPSALEQLERHEIRRHVQECIAALTLEFREALVLRDMEEYSYEEIATVLHLSGGTVRSRISRARDAVRECLKRVIEVWQ